MLMELTHVQRVRILYKTILKLHRGLPSELQPLGNNYARDEFKRHKKCNPSEAAVFLSEWTLYAVNLARQLGLRGPRTSKPLGEHLDEEKLHEMSDDQLQQLYELHQAAKNPSTNPEP